MEPLKVLLLVSFLSLIYAEIDNPNTQKIKTNREECLKEVGLDQSVFRKLRSGEQVDTSKLKDLALCILKKSGHIDNNGVFLLDKIKADWNTFTSTFSQAAGLSEQAVNNIIKECTVQQESPRETAYRFFNCLRRSVRSGQHQKQQN